MKNSPYALRELVSAIYVDAPDKSSGKRQHIHIKYDGLGYIPLDELEAKERRDRSHAKSSPFRGAFANTVLWELCYGNALLYILLSYVDFFRVRPGGRPVFVLSLIFLLAPSHILQIFLRIAIQNQIDSPVGHCR